MFNTAERAQLRLLMAITGPAGSGKTVSSLKILSYLTNGEGVFAIDTEHKRMRQYATIAGEQPDFENRRFAFKVAEIEDYSPSTYLKAMDAAEKAGAKAIFIDSLSHAWNGRGGILDQKAKLDNSGKGNSYTNWNSLTPVQNELIERIMALPFHVIVSMRSKTEYILETNSNGKQVPRKVGLEPVQRDDTEFNFDIVAMMDADHSMSFVKDTSGLFEGKQLVKPGREFAEMLIPWLNDGTILPMTRSEFVAQCGEDFGMAENEVGKLLAELHITAQGFDKYNKLFAALQEHFAKESVK